MIKLVLIIIIVILFAVFGLSLLKSDKPVNIPGTNQSASPSDAIDGANNAVQQSQDVQNKVNNYADELNR